MPTSSQQLFVNLPVQNLQNSIAFFTALGFGFDPQWTDETAACMLIGVNMFAMLLTHEKFMEFSPHPIADTHKATEVLIALSLADRAQVDEMVRKAVSAGGSTYKQPQDHGFMYGHSFQDLDGHVWEVLCMDLPAFEKLQQEVKS